jgi:hypothetical protein
LQSADKAKPLDQRLLASARSSHFSRAR